MKKHAILFTVFLTLVILILLSTACNFSTSSSPGLQLDARSSDGSVSGSYQYAKDGDSKSILFTVNPEGRATFQVKGSQKSSALTIEYNMQEIPTMSWQGSTLDGLGVLTSEEERLLNDLQESDLAHALKMIPLDLSCQGEKYIDPKQLAALLYPLQMHLKYQIPDRKSASNELISLSKCNFDSGSTDTENYTIESMISISASSPVPVVIGYFPFDEKGALEIANNDKNIAKMACLEMNSMPIRNNFGISPMPSEIKTFDDDPIQNEWGPCEAKCRGACGPDCTHNNCTVNIEERCEKNQDGENDGYFSLVHVYDCGLHPACVEHDACYDDCNRKYGCNTWAAAVCMHAGVLDPTTPWTSIFGINISCDKTTLNEENFSNVKDWVRGFGPHTTRQVYEYYDKDVRFEYDPITCPLPDEQENGEPKDEVEIEPEVKTTEPVINDSTFGTYKGVITFNSWEENVDQLNGKGQYLTNEVVVKVSENGKVSGTIDYSYVSVPLVDSAGCEIMLIYDGRGEFSGALDSNQGMVDLDFSLDRSVDYSCDRIGDTDVVTMTYPFAIQVEGNQMNGTSTFSFPDFPEKTWILSFTAEKP